MKQQSWKQTNQSELVAPYTGRLLILDLLPWGFLPEESWHVGKKCANNTPVYRHIWWSASDTFYFRLVKTGVEILSLDSWEYSAFVDRGRSKKQGLQAEILTLTREDLPGKQIVTTTSTIDWHLMPDDYVYRPAHLPLPKHRNESISYTEWPWHVSGWRMPVKTVKTVWVTAGENPTSKCCI